MSTGSAVPGPAASAAAAASQPSLFQCGSCKRSYSRLDHLARHVRSHTQVKPYQCQVCNKRFGRMFASPFLQPQGLVTTTHRCICPRTPADSGSDLLKRHAAGHDARGGGTASQRASLAQEPGTEDPGRVSQACVACAKMHLKCEEEKPCQRCRKRNIPCRWNDRYYTAGLEMPDSSAPHEGGAPTTSSGVSLPHRPSAPTVAPSTLSDMAGPQQTYQMPSGSMPLVLGQETAPTEASTMAAYLGNGATNFVGPFNGPFDTPAMFGSCGPFALQDGPDAEPTLELDEMDLSFLDSYNTNIPFQAGGSPANTLSAASAAASSSSQAPAPAGIPSYDSIGSETFRRLYWRFKPTRHDSGTAEEHNLSLTSSEAADGSHDFPESRILLDRRTTAEKLSQATRDKILAMVIETVKPENRARAVQAFPSVDLLDVLLQYYLTNPIVLPDAVFHLPSFNPNRKRPELLAAMVAAGATLTADAAFAKLGFAIQECVRQVIPKMWERDNSLVRDLEYHQAYLITLEVALWSGISRKMEIAESFLQPTLTMCRRGGKLRRSSYRGVSITLNDTPEALEAAWHDWIQEESWKRLMLRMMIHDSHSSLAMLAPPLVSYAEAQFPLPEHRDCWSAPSAQQWRVVHLSKPQERRPSVVDIVNDVDLLRRSGDVIDGHIAAMGFFTAAWNMIWEYLQLSSMHKQQQQQQASMSAPRQQWSALLLTSRHDELVQLLQHFSISLSDRRYKLPLHSELALMHLHISIEDVQLLAGAEGPEETRRVLPWLLDWARGSSARRAVWHAGQVVRIARGSRKTILRGPLGITLYHASLAFWAYGLLRQRYGDGAGSTGFASAYHSTAEHMVVPVDSDAAADSSDVQRFVQLGLGRPAIRRELAEPTPGPDEGNAGSDGRNALVLLDDPAAIMEVVMDVLRSNFEGTNKPRLVEKLIQLMSGLQAAAKKTVANKQ